MMPSEQRGDSGIRWPELLAELGKMESRIMAGVREAAAAAHTTSDRLDGRLLEHSAQHSRDRTEHQVEHQAQWDAHYQQHEAARAAAIEERRTTESRTFSSRTIKIGVAALVVQFVPIAAAAVTLLVKSIH